MTATVLDGNGRAFVRRAIYRGTVMPRTGHVLDEMSWIFACPHCEYQWSALTEEAIRATALIHCRCAGGVAHDRFIVDLLADETPMFHGLLT